MSYDYGEYATEDNDFSGYTTVDNILGEWSEYILQNMKKNKNSNPRPI